MSMRIQTPIPNTIPVEHVLRCLLTQSHSTLLYCYCIRGAGHIIEAVLVGSGRMHWKSFAGSGSESCCGTTAFR
jgi:hypothetical protein